MKSFNIESEKSQKNLVPLFNTRDEDAYVFVYELYYPQLYLFANKLYAETEVDAADVIHDVFTYIWSNKSTKFNSLAHIKGYLFLSIRNSYRTYIDHRKYIDTYNSEILKDDDYVVSQMIEIDVVSKLSLMLDILPEECAKVMRLYLEGMEMKDISKTLGKSLSTVYNQKTEAISILKKKFPKELLSVLIAILN